MVRNNERLYRQIARNISLKPMGRRKEVMPKSVLIICRKMALFRAPVCFCYGREMEH
jgi:hypothetical protein